ncbi:MAG: hypothetical protein KDB80_08070 [Planctomycetes bacterium]|nr:hypothetical protein [Planctomycetota bacterium]
MPATPDDDPILERIANAITVLSAIRDPHAALRQLQMAIESLTAAAKAIEARDAELDLVTAPDRDAAAEIARLRQQLEEARDQIVTAELRAVESDQEREMEAQVHADDAARLAKLERKSRDLDALLMEDEEAFGRYMDRAMDEDDRRRGGPPKRH